MIPSSLYTHPRPRILYEPPVVNQPRQPVTRPSAEARLRAIRQAKRVEQEVVRDWWPQLNVDSRESLPSHYAEEDKRIVGAARRQKHQMQMPEARKSTNLVCEPGKAFGPLSILPLSTPSAPVMEYTSLPGCTDSCVGTPVRRYLPVSSQPPHSSRRHVTAGDPMQRSTTRLVKGSEDAHQPSPAPKHGTGHRPSRSHSSSLRQSLSRPSSRQSLIADPTTNAVPRDRTSSASKLLSFVRRLAPLPRFNPYRRSRAESTSAIVDVQNRKTDQVSQGFRRRSKSDSMVSS